MATLARSLSILFVKMYLSISTTELKNPSSTTDESIINTYDGGSGGLSI
jgi:hypothetical protein